jgi:hypothetical protein
MDLSTKSNENCLPKMSNIYQNNLSYTTIRGLSMVSLLIDGKERVCLAQISNSLLKKFTYNEIHNRRVALGINCIQCTPLQLDILRSTGAMPVSSRRCGMITKREAERLVKSFLDDNKPLTLPDNFAFDVQHKCGFGCRGIFFPSRYNSSRAKCIRCYYCFAFFSPNKFIFHMHETSNSKYVKPETANFNSWRRHISLINETGNDELSSAWEDVKSIFNGGKRKRNQHSPVSSHYCDDNDSDLDCSLNDSSTEFNNNNKIKLDNQQNNNNKNEKLNQEEFDETEEDDTTNTNNEKLTNNNDLNTKFDFNENLLKLNPFLNPFLNQAFNLTHLLPEIFGISNNSLLVAGQSNWDRTDSSLLRQKLFSNQLLKGTSSSSSSSSSSTTNTSTIDEHVNNNNNKQKKFDYANICNNLFNSNSVSTETKLNGNKRKKENKEKIYHYENDEEENEEENENEDVNVDELVQDNKTEISNNNNSKSAFKPPEILINKHKTKNFFSLVDHI